MSISTVCTSLTVTKYPPDFHPFLAPKKTAPSTQNVIASSIEAVLRNFLPPTRADTRADLISDHDMITEYSNAIAWSVDEFFRHLLPEVDLSKTLIIYTSDHGQSLLPGQMTHCSFTPPTVASSEAFVPLFAITSLPEFKQRLEKGGNSGLAGSVIFKSFQHCCWQWDTTAVGSPDHTVQA